MRKFFASSISALFLLSALNCGEFPAQYARIEPNVIRSEGFVYEPSADASPGDTLRIKLFLSGEKVESVRWLTSYNHIISTYGTDTVLDLTEIPAIQKNSWLPDSEEVRFIVPDSVFFTTKSISPAALNQLKASLPSSMRSMTQWQLAALLKDFSAVDFNNPATMLVFMATWGPTLGVSTMDSASIASLAAIGGAIATVFSIPAIVDADVGAPNGDKLKIRGHFTVRYNAAFQNTPLGRYLPFNHNPEVRWVGVYKVKGKDIATFFPGDPAFAGKFTLSYLYNELHPDSVHDTLAIEPGYSYFLGADSGIATYALKKGDTLPRWGTPWIAPNDTVLADTSLDRIYYQKDGRTTYELETYLYDWEFQNMAMDSVTLPLDSLMALPDASPNGGGDQPPIMRMLPPLDKKMTRARIWVTVYDKLYGDYNRPNGFAIKTVDLYFKF